MARKREASLESLFDEVEPYLRLFARLLIIYLILRLFRAIGMTSGFLDWLEHADLGFAGLSFAVFLLDNAIGLIVTFWGKRLSASSENEEETE